MRAHGTMTERDYVAAQVLHLRPGFFILSGILLAVALALWAVLGVGFAPLVAAAAFIVVWSAVMIPWRARRTFREYKAASEPFSMDVRDDGLFFERPRSSGLVPWSHLIKWRASSSLVLLYPARNLFYLVPKHCFADPKEF